MLSAGFDTWRKSEYNAFIQGCALFGKEAFEQIAEYIETKTAEEVAEYARAFWTVGKLYLNDFEKVTQKMAQQAVYREEVAHYQELATQKVLGAASPLEIDFPFCRSTAFSSEVDLLILMGVACYGWGEWPKIRGLLNQYVPFQFDTSVRLRGDVELCRRAEAVMKSVKKEREEMSTRQNNEKESILQELQTLEANQQQIQSEMEEIQIQIQNLQKYVDETREEQFNHRLRLSDFNLSEEMILQLVPICEMFRGGVIANLAELEKYVRQKLILPRKTLQNLIAMFVEKRGTRSKFMLKEMYINKDLQCVDFSCDMEMSPAVRQCCLEQAALTKAADGPHVLDVKSIIMQMEKEREAKTDKLVQLVEGKSIAVGQLMEKEVLEMVGVTEEEMKKLIGKELTVKNVWVEEKYDV